MTTLIEEKAVKLAFTSAREYKPEWADLLREEWKKEAKAAPSPPPRKTSNGNTGKIGAKRIAVQSCVTSSWQTSAEIFEAAQLTEEIGPDDKRNVKNTLERMHRDKVVEKDTRAGKFGSVSFWRLA